MGIAASLTEALPAWGVDVPFTERVISTAADGALSVFATDLDGDGDTDVVSASGNDFKIAWYESDGGSPPTFTERVISTTSVGATSVFATDVDGDGDTDVLSASALNNKIAWYENDGGSPPAFTEHAISYAANGALSVFATDLDGDGDTDVLSASYRDDKIAWYESDGGLPPTFTERVISRRAYSRGVVFATDVDGDGDTDVLSGSQFEGKIAWYENDGGSPPTFTDRTISITAGGAYSVFATDLDGDGDTDVLTGGASIAWYENDGDTPPNFTERVISPTVNAAFSVFATDVDGDGDIDVLSASYFDDKIAWYESNGGSPPTFTERVISTTADGAYSVFATDVDGDGDTDVLSASFLDNKIAWYENTTPPPPPAAGGAGSRYLSITPALRANPVALVVTPMCPGATSKYVGMPSDPDNIALLMDNPAGAAFLTPEEWSHTVHVTAANIVPDADYQVQQDNGTPGAPAFTDAITARTAIWGDSVGNFVDGRWQAPDGDIMITDVTAVIAAFTGANGAPPIYQADMRGSVDPCTPDREIDIVDALAAVHGFQGLGYLESFPECSKPCP